jgi:hypothetical protein
MDPKTSMDPPQKSAVASEIFDPGVALELQWHRMCGIDSEPADPLQ